jgi:hypothetical protein
MADDKVDSLGSFVIRVGQCRKDWRISESKELWFRGESREYPTRLRPELYRSRQDPITGKDLPLKPASELLEIENDLYEDFQRCAVQLRIEKTSEEDWDWDSYFLMQHHDAPTRLLDWSDGALMALHFAVRNKRDDAQDAFVYVLEPYRLMEQIEALPDIESIKLNWDAYVEKNPSYGFKKHMWEDSYLPADEEDLGELSFPGPPLVLEFPHITRRVAAQRSRFIVFGTAPDWLAEKVGKPDFPIQVIPIAGSSRHNIRQELRDCGITESVIYPDLDGLGREMRQRWEDLK